MSERHGSIDNMFPVNEEKVDGANPRRMMNIWRWIAGIGVAGCIYLIFNELGKTEKYNRLFDEYYGGPDPQAIFFYAVLTAGFAVLFVWAHRAIRRYDAS